MLLLRLKEPLFYAIKSRSVFPIDFFFQSGMQFWSNTHLESNQSGQISETPNEWCLSEFSKTQIVQINSELSRRLFLNSQETMKQMLIRLTSETLESTSLEILKQKLPFPWFHDVFMGRISQVLHCLAPWVTVLEDTSRQAGRRGNAHWCPSGWTVSTEKRWQGW